MALKSLPHEPELDLDTYDRVTWGISISRGGDIRLLGSNRICIGHCAPLSELRHTTNMLHALGCVLTGKKHPLELQFDAVDWTALPKIIPHVQQLIDSPNRLNHPSFLENVDEYKRLHALQAKEITTVCNVGMHYFKSENYSSALESYIRVWNTILLFYGTTSETSARISYNIGRTHQEMGDSEHALKYFTLSLNIRNELYGEDSQEAEKVNLRINSFPNTTDNLSQNTV